MFTFYKFHLATLTGKISLLVFFFVYFLSVLHALNSLNSLSLYNKKLILSTQEALQ